MSHSAYIVLNESRINNAQAQWHYHFYLFLSLLPNNENPSNKSCDYERNLHKDFLLYIAKTFSYWGGALNHNCILIWVDKFSCIRIRNVNERNRIIMLGISSMLKRMMLSRMIRSLFAKWNIESRKKLRRSLQFYVKNKLKKANFFTKNHKI